MSTSSNVKTLATPVNVHGQLCDTLVIDPRVANDYKADKVQANVTLTSAEFVVDGVFKQPQGQPNSSTGISKRYSSTVSSFDAATVYAAIFAAVAAETNYTYSA